MTSSAWTRFARYWTRATRTAIKRVHSYERSHKNRAGVIDASERELARA